MRRKPPATGRKQSPGVSSAAMKPPRTLSMLDACATKVADKEEETDIELHRSMKLIAKSKRRKKAIELEGGVLAELMGRSSAYNAAREIARRAPRLGILRLDYNYPAALGDVDCPASFTYPVVYLQRVV